MKKFFLNIMKTHSSNWTALVIRVPLGLSFMTHGWGKLFGKGNPEGFAGFLHGLGLDPSYPLAVMAGLSETVGGLFIVLGLFTRLAAASHVILMSVIIVFVHISQPVFGQGSFELQLFMLMMSFILLMQGGGKLSLDSKLS